MKKVFFIEENEKIIYYNLNLREEQECLTNDFNHLKIAVISGIKNDFTVEFRQEKGGEFGSRIIFNTYEDVEKKWGKWEKRYSNHFSNRLIKKLCK